MRDVAIVGLGPAGRSLAHHCAARGLNVLAIDPAPQAPWRPTYGVWADEIAGLLPDSALRSRIDRPAMAAPMPRPLPRTYVVLDNAGVQAHLHLRGVEIREQRLDDAGVSALRREARVVVDARGARPDPRRPLDDGPAQTAYGIVVADDDARPALRGHSGLLMDWALDWAPDPARPDARAVPTFLYAIPLGDGTTLLEETALAAFPALDLPELRERLHRRLRRRGVEPAVLAAPLKEEHVVIPMRGRAAPAPAGAHSFGTAGGGGNIVTGYSVAHSLRAAPMVADRLAAGQEWPQREAPPGAEVLRNLGLRALLRLDVEGTLALFDAFSRVPAPSQRAFLDRSSTASPLLTSMGRMWVRMPPRDMVELVRATFSPR